MNAYAGRTGVPKPPDDIWHALSAAGATGDPIALGIAQARYRAWLTAQGIPWQHQGTHRPDEVDK